MSETIKGKILGKTLSEDPNGEWQRVSFEINEKRYSSFDTKVIEGFNPSDYVEVEFEKSKDGKYNNIRNIKKIEQPKDFQKASEYAPKEVDWDAKDLRNARMNALNNTTELLHTLSLVDPEKTKEILKEANAITLIKDMADQLVGYIYS